MSRCGWVTPCCGLLLVASTLVACLLPTLVDSHSRGLFDFYFGPRLASTERARVNKRLSYLLSRGSYIRRSHYFGRTVTVADSSAHHIAKILAEVESGIYKLHQPGTWAQLPLSRPNATIIDIGGNFGAFSLAVKARFPQSRLLTFEAMPPTCRHLQYGLAATLGYKIRKKHKREPLLQIPGVTVECSALGDGKPLHLVHYRWGSCCASSHYKFDDRSFDSDDYVHYHNISSHSLDSLLERHGVGKVDLLKIDCEGCEYSVMRASRRLRDIRALVGEFHMNDALARQGHSPEGLRAFLRAANPDMLVSVVDAPMQNS